MAPAASLQDLIEAVRTEAPGDDPLDQLAHASRTAAELAQLGDALVSHFVEQSRLRGHSWSQISTALGVTKQAAHKRFSFPEIRIKPTLNRFTPGARAALLGAGRHAAASRHKGTGSDDLLLALFEPADSVAAQILREAGITREACEHELAGDRATGAAAPAGAPRGGMRSLKAVVKSAVAEALALEHSYVGTEHLLLGLYRDPEDPVARMLVALGASRDDTRRRLVAKLQRR